MKLWNKTTMQIPDNCMWCRGDDHLSGAILGARFPRDCNIYSSYHTLKREHLNFNGRLLIR